MHHPGNHPDHHTTAAVTSPAPKNGAKNNVPNTGAPAPGNGANEAVAKPAGKSAGKNQKTKNGNGSPSGKNQSGDGQASQPGKPSGQTMPAGMPAPDMPSGKMGLVLPESVSSPTRAIPRLDKVTASAFTVREPSHNPPSKGDGKDVVFEMDDKNAHDIRLLGSFTNWDKSPITLRKVGSNRWQTKVHLGPGRYQYRFLVDGEWRDDPHATKRSPNPYGTFDSIVEVS